MTGALGPAADPAPVTEELAGTGASGTGASDTGEAPTAAAVPGSAPGDAAIDRPASRWRTWRAPLLVVAGLVILAVVLARLAGPVQQGYLDPSAVDPAGSRALATLLANAGVDVNRTESLREVLNRAPGETVIVADPRLVTGAAADQILAAQPSRIVLVDWDPDLVGFGVPAGIGATYDGVRETVPAQCSFRPASRAEEATFDAVRYTLDDGEDATGCFGSDGYGLVVVPGSPEIVLLASGTPLTNSALADAGNAALGMNLLGATDELVWWLPSSVDPALSGSETAGGLLPPWVTLLAVQLVVAALLVAYWRGRRLGRVVTEPLPVVVDAAETTLGRGRLLQANRARDTAAAHLRERTVQVLSGRLDLPPQAAPDTVLAAVAGHTSLPAAQVAALLFGQPPTTDDELVRMAQGLANLTAEVTGR